MFYNALVLRKCIKKINSAIQWTKKWHFFHVLFIVTFSLLLTIILLLYSIDTTHTYETCSNCVDPTTIYPDTPEFIRDAFVLLIIICLHAGLMAAPITEILAVVIKAILRKKLCVEWNFLLNNKFYNIFYYFSIIYILTCAIYFYLPSSVTSYFSKFFQALPWVS